MHNYYKLLTSRICTGRFDCFEPYFVGVILHLRPIKRGVGGKWVHNGAILERGNRDKAGSGIGGVFPHH